VAAAISFACELSESPFVSRHRLVKSPADELRVACEDYFF